MTDKTRTLLRELQTAGSTLRQASAAKDWVAMARGDLAIRQLLADPLSKHPALRPAVAQLADIHRQSLAAAQIECERLGAQMQKLAGNREALLGYSEMLEDPG